MTGGIDGKRRVDRPRGSREHRANAPSAVASGLRQKVVSSMLWVGGTRLIARSFDQVFTIVLARLLLPADFGIIAMASVFTRVFNLLTHMGLGQAIVQRREVDDEYLSTAFWANFASGLTLSAVGLVLSGLIARFYAQPLVGPVFAVLALRFAFGGASAAQSALLSRQMRFALVESRNLTSQALGGVVGVGLAVAGGGVWSLVAQVLTADVARTIMLWRAATWRPRRVFVWAKFKEMWAFGSRMLGSQFFNYVVKYSDNLLIGRTLGAALLGYYAFAYALFLTPIVEIALTVNRVTLSAFSRLQDDSGRLRQGFLMTTVYVAFFAGPALVGLSLVSSDLVAVVFSAKWLPAVPVLRILLVGALFQSQSVIFNSAFTAVGRVDLFLRWTIVSAVVYVPAFVIGLRWGIIGVAAGYTVVTIVLVPVQLLLVQRILNFRMRDYVGAIAPVAVATAVMGACVALARSWLSGEAIDPILRLAAAVFVGASSYLTATWLVRPALLTDLTKMLDRLRGARRQSLAEEAGVVS